MSVNCDLSDICHNTPTSGDLDLLQPPDCDQCGCVETCLSNEGKKINSKDYRRCRAR